MPCLLMDYVREGGWRELSKEESDAGNQCSARNRFSMKSVCVEMLAYPMRS
jgi:hypothetical protein